MSKEGYMVGEWRKDKLIKGTYFDKDDNMLLDGTFNGDQMIQGTLYIKINGCKGEYKGKIKSGLPEGWGYVKAGETEYEGAFKSG